MSPGRRYGVEIRGALLADATELAIFLQGDGPAIPPLQMSERLERLLRDPASAVLVAADYGPLAGVIALHWHSTLRDNRPVARISALRVAEADRRRGIGRLLLKAGAQAARQAGCDRLEAAPPSGAAAGLAFLRDSGFTEEGPALSRGLRKRQDQGGSL
ncbi:Acetyltransferase [Roseomonas mucosa]|uniref:GNAT family N-acetyltransferase n=1 Tax=Roseomonas TaxID=125216 RepID=UPI000C181C23|nr:MULTISPECIES: GNAT family N-acetyltransferase [Roseomonas]ATR19797.1 GNAT family N-acetyltransferase [Roseomonas sp. FDAARGOS_362]MDT8262843.1 GNAT family N-acetyltransferase [Roseomonas sp. DSM 102946]UZO98055.1 Acetyltransferase [Roseomonas mucosa]